MRLVTTCPQRTQVVGLVGGGRRADASADGSRIFVRLVALKTPTPISTITPTPIHIEGMFNNTAAAASPTIKIKKPMRYVPKADIGPHTLRDTAI